MEVRPQVRVTLVWLACAIAFGTGCATTAAETARGTWFEIKSPRFQVWTDGDPEVARALVVDLERFHQVAMATTRNVEEPEAAPPLRIFLAKDGGSFRALSGKGGMTAGIFRPTYRGNYAIAEAQQTQSSATQLSDRHVLFHEYSHYIIALKGARVPSWYNEGFAEYMATTEFRDGSYTMGCPPLYRTAYVDQLRWLPVEQVLEADDVAALMHQGSGYVRTRRDPTDGYLQSWYMFHYFASDGARSAQLREYLQLWVSGEPIEQAVQRAFGQSIGQLDAIMHQHAMKKALDCVSITPATALKEPAVTVAPVSTAEAHYHIGDLLLASFGPTDAVFELLGKADDGSADARPLRALARAHWSKARATEGDPTAEIEKARKYLERAQALAPDHPEALAIDGHLWSLQAERVGATDAAAGKEAVKRARKCYRRAIKVDEAIAEAYYGLGLTYLMDDNGSKEARVTLEVAAFLLPLDTDIALALGKILIKRGSVLEAIPALEYAVHMSSDDKQRGEARKMLDELRKRAAEAGAAPAAPAPAAATVESGTAP